MQDGAKVSNIWVQNNGTDLMFDVGANVGAGVAPKFTIRDTGNVGIGTSSTTAQLHTTGTVRFQNFGVGVLYSDANGNITGSSDERLKNVVGAFSPSVEALRGIKPILYYWNEQSGLDREHVYAGFSAQNIKEFIPEAVGMDSRGYLTLSDRPILAAAINAIQEFDISLMSLASSTAATSSLNLHGEQQLTFLGKFLTRLTQWFADRANGIGDFFARRVRTQELCVSDGAGPETCITKSQLDALLQSAANQGNGGGGPPPVVPPTDPTPEPEPEPTPDPETEPTPEPDPEPEPEPTPEPETPPVVPPTDPTPEPDTPPTDPATVPQG